MIISLVINNIYRSHNSYVLKISLYRIVELNKLAIDLEITSTAIDSDKHQIIETETKLLLDIETFIDYITKEKDKSFETYMASQYLVLEQTAELSKNRKNWMTIKNFFKPNLVLSNNRPIYNYRICSRHTSIN